jgi:hypothetical protein
VDREPRPLTWKATQSRLRSLKAAEWPKRVVQDEHQTRIEAADENDRLWDVATRPYQALSRRTSPFENDSDLREHALLLAYRFTRLLATVSMVIARDGLLARVPSHPDGWSEPLPEIKTGPVFLPQGITLDPRGCSGPLYADTLLGAMHLLSNNFNGPLHWIAKWLNEDNQDRLYLVWPTPQNLLAFEDCLVTASTAILLRKGRLAALNFMRDKFDATPEEARDLLQVTFVQFKELGRVDLDVERGLALARAEDFQRRARKACNLKAEYDGMKLHAVVSGLTRESPLRDDGKDTDFREIIAEVVRNDGPPQLPAPPPNDEDPTEP